VDPVWKTILWQQLGAAIDMLENAMRACPADLWGDPSKQPEWNSHSVVGFWYVAYHTIFFLDLNLSGSVEGFAPPAPFNLDELDPAGLLPERMFTKDELLNYVEHCRRKCRAAIQALTEEKARERFEFGSSDISFAELLVYSMRHVEHHVGQLNLLLRQGTGSAPGYVRRAAAPLSGA
jgi:hypothetical protein